MERKEAHTSSPMTASRFRSWWAWVAIVALRMSARSLSASKSRSGLQPQAGQVWQVRLTT